MRYLSHNLASHNIYRNELLGEGSVFRFLLVLRFSLLQKSVCQEEVEEEERNGKEVEERNGKEVEERNGKEEEEE